MIAIALIAALAVGVGAVLLGPTGMGTDQTRAYTVPGLDPMTMDEAQTAFYRITPALLLVVYDAFGRMGEADIYDTLARVAGADALE